MIEADDRKTSDRKKKDQPAVRCTKACDPVDQQGKASRVGANRKAQKYSKDKIAEERVDIKSNGSHLLFAEFMFLIRLRYTEVRFSILFCLLFCLIHDFN